MVQSSFATDREALAQIWKKQKKTVVFTQNCIQPVTTYQSGQQITLVFQQSDSFLDLSKVQFLYRPVIQTTDAQGMTQLQRDMCCFTPVDGNSVFQVQSVTLNGAQLLSQPQSNQSTAQRSIFQKYWSCFMSNKPSKKMSGTGDVFCSIVSGGFSGSPLYNVIEQGITHPSNKLFTDMQSVAASKGTGGNGSPVDVPETTNANSSQFEADPYPRAIVDRLTNLYQDFNYSQSVDNKTFGCTYYGQQISNFADSILARKFPTALYLLNFPLLAQAITPSSAVYHRQQAQFAAYRAKWIQQTVTPYLYETTDQADYTKTLCPKQYCGSATGADTLNQADEANGDPAGTIPKPIDPAGASGTNRTLAADFAQTRMCYGRSVQNSIMGTSVARAGGKLWTPDDSNLSCKEQYTQCSVSLGELSVEIEQCGLLSMKSLQIIVQLQVNLNYNALSFYGPAGITLNPYSSYVSPDGLIAPSQYKQFLDGCVIANSVQMTIVDPMCRIEYITFDEQEGASAIMDALCRQPKPYVSIRTQLDNLPSSGIFTQRLSLGSNKLISAVMVLFLPSNRNKPVYQGGIHREGPLGQIPLCQDTCINYQSFQPLTDGRSTLYDSYYQQMSQIFVEANNRRFYSQDIGLSDPQLSTYLLTQAGLQTALNKYIKLDLQTYLTNRFFAIIPINVTGNQEMALKDQQISVVVNIDPADREKVSQSMNTIIQSFDGQFSMLSIALTMQNLVECQEIRM